jgi:hypothetical protein
MKIKELVNTSLSEVNFKSIGQKIGTAAGAVKQFGAGMQASQDARNERPGKGATSGSTLSAAVDDIDPTEFRNILNKTLSGQQLNPQELQVLKQINNKL